MHSVRTGASAAGTRAAPGRMALAGTQARVAVPDAAPDPDIGVLALNDAGQPVARAAPRDDALAPLTSLLGARVAAANPVWGPHALALLRALQKKLIAQALLVDAPARRPLLDAVAVVEQAVTMRVRMLQMAFAGTDGDAAEAAPAPPRRAAMSQLFEQPATLPAHQGSAYEPEEDAAIGLAWGMLGTRRFHAADSLVRGSLAVWPHQPLLHLLGAYAAGETGQAPTPAVHRLLRQTGYAALAALIARRAAPPAPGSFA